MPDHVFYKDKLILLLDSCLGKTFGDLDNKGLFTNVKQFNLQKGIAGTVVEQCVFNYPPDTKQAPDLLIYSDNHSQKTELKTTGMLIETSPEKHLVAKEPMTITAVGIYDIGNQQFEDSHFWAKIEHMLIIYYLYTSESKSSTTPSDYQHFPIKGYEFHEFSDVDKAILRKDWQSVRDLCADIVSNHPGDRNIHWKDDVKKEYIDRHRVLRQKLTYIDLAPMYPPRFRLKKPLVSSIIGKHFGYELEQLPNKYVGMEDIDIKCSELTNKYRGRTVRELSKLLDIEYNSKDKAISEKITVAMFGGDSRLKMNQIGIFSKFGLIGKSVVMDKNGGRTEDMKLFPVDFEEMTKQRFVDDEGNEREYQFEDSFIYSFFADHELLCIVFEEPLLKRGANQIVELGDNRFLGFKRVVFSDDFIETAVKKVWIDTRDKILNKKLRDVVQFGKDGNPVVNKRSGSIKSAPNFIKGSENSVFIRGSATDSSLKYKTEVINGIKMLPQSIWIKGAVIVRELGGLR